MAEKDEVPQDLYIGAYDDASTAEEDWNALKKLVADKVLEVGALALVNRDTDGEIHVKDTTRETGVGATIGAVGGALVGLIFPPSLLASAAVGAGIGAGGGAVVDRVTRRKIKADVEWILPPGGSGIVVIFDEKWVNEVEKALARSQKISRDHVHDDDDDNDVDDPVTPWRED